MKKYQIRKIKKVIQKFKEKKIFTLASSVAFYAFLSLFPFFILVISFSSLFLKEALIQEKIRNYFRIFPRSVADTFVGNIESMLESGEVFSMISFVFLLYFSFKVFSHLEEALSIIFGTTKIRIGWVEKLKAFLFFLFTALLLLVLFILEGAFLLLASNLEKIPIIRSYYIILVGNFIAEASFFSFSYKYFSLKKLRFKNLVIGGIVAAVLWEILKHIFGIYIASINRYLIIYGSIGSIILLQLWLYYSFLVYLFGAEISADLN